MFCWPPDGAQDDQQRAAGALALARAAHDAHPENVARPDGAADDGAILFPALPPRLFCSLLAMRGCRALFEFACRCPRSGENEISEAHKHHEVVGSRQVRLPCCGQAPRQGACPCASTTRRRPTPTVTWPLQTEFGKTAQKIATQTHVPRSVTCVPRLACSVFCVLCSACSVFHVPFSCPLFLVLRALPSRKPARPDGASQRHQPNNTMPRDRTPGLISIPR